MNPIQLKPDEVHYLKSFTSSGQKNVREVNRAYILLLLHKGKKSREIQEILEVDPATIWRTKKKYLERGVAGALKDKDRPGQPKKYGPRHQAEVIALACSDAPEGRERWTLELLVREAKKRKGLETINRESIRLMLKKTNVSLG